MNDFQKFEQLSSAVTLLAEAITPLMRHFDITAALAGERIDQLKGHQEEIEEWWGTARCALECDCKWQAVKAHAVAMGIEIIGHHKKQKIRATDVRKIMKHLGMNPDGQSV